MRTPILLSLLLLGGLQAAIAPATAPDELDRRLGFTSGSCEIPPTPAENATSFKRLTDAPRQSVLTGNGKPQKSALAGAPNLAPDSGAASSQVRAAGRAEAESIQLRPTKPRAPPSAPLF